MTNESQSEEFEFLVEWLHQGLTNSKQFSTSTPGQSINQTIARGLATELFEHLGPDMHWELLSKNAKLKLENQDLRMQIAQVQHIVSNSNKGFTL